MALRTNTKVSTKKTGLDGRLYQEVIDEPAADDIVQFLAMTEGYRRYVAQPRGVQQEPMILSDQLKERLLGLEE